MLKPKQLAVIRTFLQGKIGPVEAAQTLGVTRMKFYMLVVEYARERELSA
jgi:hypothetical protein